MIKLILNETWKLIPNSTGYEVSNRGRVRSPRSKTCQNKIVGGNILSSSSLNSYGYPRVNIKLIDGSFKECLIHRLVAEAFIPNDDTSKTDVNHKDENKLNNDVSNLEWCTKEYNNNYGIRSAKSKLAQVYIYKVYDNNSKSYIDKDFLGVKDIAKHFNCTVPHLYTKSFRRSYTIEKILKFN